MAYDRLTPVELLPLSPSEGEARTRLSIRHNGEDKQATVRARAVDGQVYVQFDGDDNEKVVDLGQLDYKWL